MLIMSAHNDHVALTRTQAADDIRRFRALKFLLGQKISIAADLAEQFLEPRGAFLIALRNCLHRLQDGRLLRGCKLDLLCRSYAVHEEPENCDRQTEPAHRLAILHGGPRLRSEEHTSELQSQSFI